VALTRRFFITALLTSSLCARQRVSAPHSLAYFDVLKTPVCARQEVSATQSLASFCCRDDSLALCLTACECHSPAGFI
jgi:hypothetical protein